MKTDPVALRSTYPSGKYRPITKPQMAEFKRRVWALMAETGLPLIRDEWDRESWVFDSPRFGLFKVTWPMDQSVIWTVWTRFEGDLVALRAEFPQSAHFASDPNTYSGKWNVHSMVADAAIADLRYQLVTVGALSRVAIPA